MEDGVCLTESPHEVIVNVAPVSQQYTILPFFSSKLPPELAAAAAAAVKTKLNDPGECFPRPENCHPLLVEQKTNAAGLGCASQTLETPLRTFSMRECQKSRLERIAEAQQSYGTRHRLCQVPTVPIAQPVIFERIQQTVMAPSGARRAPEALVSTTEVAPLTPPEEMDDFTWASSVACSSNDSRIRSTPSEETGIIQSSSASGPSFASTERPSAISLPIMSRMAQADEASPPWLDAVANTIVSAQDQPLSGGHIQMVVQALPSQRKGSHSKPVFQHLAELLQQQGQEAPYITITHVVSSLLILGDVPTSPPATPNRLNTTDSYFDSQTIFTHAATGPIYHPPSQRSVGSLPRVAGIITAPASVNVSTLERYIPPTTLEEVRDFFTLSRKSYLVDRMTELSPRNGILLLVYPTANGAATFANSYLGPLIEPFLRRFCLLNDIGMDAASRMGKIAALPAMMSFEEMSTCLDKLCIDLAERAPVGREPKSSYRVIYRETVETTIERETWIQWFIEQEGARLRQDLTDYQTASGRLMNSTPATLTREVIEGIRSSTEAISEGGIELGIFLVCRSMI